MQLIDPSSARRRLRNATCALLSLAAGSANAANFGTKWTLDAAGMVYAESKRTAVLEPVFILKRHFQDGQSLQGKFVFDSITGASPSGASSTSRVQTFTTPSGQSYQTKSGEVPLRSFKDTRVSVDAEWEKPLSRRFKSTLGGHVSSETDYSSIGATATVSLDLNRKLTTITAGGGANSDRITPSGGMPVGLTHFDPTTTENKTVSKQIQDAMIGVTQIMTRRWLWNLNYSYDHENGYLTEPYKIISLIEPGTGETLYGDYLYEKRPDTRIRQSVFFSTAYQISEDVIHFAYRNYWDDWGIRSSTFDVKYRLELSSKLFLEPHVRYYSQTAADFYVYSLPRGTPLPQYASADYRFGKLQTNTFGVKFGSRMADNMEFTLRTEYMQQSGDGHPDSAVGVQKSYDLFPPIDIFVVQAGVSVGLDQLGKRR